jgi:3-Deoxy-D-manno-octulosonic-acid transferase (kdotransferase)
MSSIRLNCYRWIANLFLGRRSGRRARALFDAPPTPVDYWFHAASAGELETLIPLIDRADRAGRTLWVTCFSRSALRALDQLKARGLRTSLSPLEGGWRALLNRAQARVFITVKYEAWPDLWASLSDSRTPLLVLGAQVRPSLHWIVRFSRILGFSIPIQLRMLSFFESAETKAESNGPQLYDLFPSAELGQINDPRWDRVYERLL